MLNKTWPFQIDGWFRVNDNREIEAFDLVFRHFSWVRPILLPLQRRSKLTSLAHGASHAVGLIAPVKILSLTCQGTESPAWCSGRSDRCKHDRR